MVFYLLSCLQLKIYCLYKARCFNYQYNTNNTKLNLNFFNKTKYIRKNVSIFYI